MAALSTIALASLAAAQGINGYVSGRRAGNAAITQGNYEANLYNQNATLADQQAADAIARGQVAEGRQRNAGKSFIGQQRTGFAGQGVDVTSGSASAVQGEAQAMSALDALTIRNNAAREAFGYKVQALNDRGNAQLALMGAKNRAQDYRNQATSSLLTAGANLYGIARSAKKGTL